MNPRYLIFTNKDDGLIDHLNFPEDFSLFTDGNDFCIIYNNNNVWVKKDFELELVSPSFFNEINQQREIIIIVEDIVNKFAIVNLKSIINNSEKNFVIIHESKKNANKKVLEDYDGLNLNNYVFRTESHFKNTFYDLHLRKLLFENIKDETINGVHSYFMIDKPFYTNLQEKEIRSKLSLLQKALPQTNISFEDFKEEYGNLNLDDQIAVNSFLNEEIDLTKLRDILLNDHH
jgi:hypothetical protein